MKIKIIKLLLTIACFCVVPITSFAGHAETANADRNSKSKSDEQLDEQGMDNFIQDIDLYKGKITIDTLKDNYEKIKNIEFKQEVVPENEHKETNLLDTFKEMLHLLFMYVCAFIKGNIIYLIIMFVLFILLILNKERRCRLNGCIQQRDNRPQGKKYTKRRGKESL